MDEKNKPKEIGKNADSEPQFTDSKMSAAQMTAEVNKVHMNTQEFDSI